MPEYTSRVADPTLFTDESNWRGGLYELCIHVGDISDERSDARLERAMVSVRRAANVQGCYSTRNLEPAEQSEIPCTLASLARAGHLYGTVPLPGGRTVVCGWYVTRDLEDGTDCLGFYMPVEALQRASIYPFDQWAGCEDLAWRRIVDDWLADVGTAVYRDVDFKFAVIGWELDVFTARDLEDGVPNEHREGYLLPSDGRLSYVPANV